MPFECYYTGKKTRFGKKRAFRGQKVSKGGFGLKPTGISPRTYRPNLQRVRALVEVTDGQGNPVLDDQGQTRRIPKRIRASAKAIRGGLVIKPLKRKYGYTRNQATA
ncbi:MAG: 50S ribosomal protein L28 [Phycisphaeraceae bacterium]|nr:50S ribosomal protein L28 [Phycisphaeraceae bacterium]